MADLRRRARPLLHERIADVRMKAGLAGQGGIGAALAWGVSHNLFGIEQPVFAPIVAAGTLASSAGKRLRSVVELAIGIALGIGVGDLLIFVIGTGAWQLALVVSLAIIAAIALSGSGAIVTQAASTSVLVVTLTPLVGRIEKPRIIDAFVGGSAALLVALVLPLNPMRVVVQVIDPLMDDLTDQLVEVGKGLRAGDGERVRRALTRLRELQDQLPALHDAIDAGRETATLAPTRWRRRGALRRYVNSGQYLHRVVHNCGTLARRAVTMIEDKEPVPSTLSDAIRLLAEAVNVLHHELASGLEPQGARIWTRRATSEAGRAYQAGVGLSGSVVVAQIRTIASDLLRATGLNRDEEEANQVVREEISRSIQIEARQQSEEQHRPVAERPGAAEFPRAAEPPAS
ncbi:MAG TPA: FUSC family protein [Micromonospora sp.]|nr:FUSC family protein [Micromonospora sp.]